MLIEYTPVSALSEAEKRQLRSLLPQMVLEGRRYIDFYGKYLAVSDLMSHQRVWEAEARASQVGTRQNLFG